MCGYSWYEEISYSDELSQGDLIYDCPIPVPSSGVYQELRQGKGEAGQTAEREEPVDIQHANSVIRLFIFPFLWWSFTGSTLYRKSICNL